MREPKRHHLVPRCYLKKFGTNKKKEWYVDVHDNQEKNIFNANIKNVCVQSEYYTIDKLPDNQKRFLEKFYANNIESNYPDIYYNLVHSNQTLISSKQKLAIITFIVSQFFRTSKTANHLNEFLNQGLEKANRMMDFEKGIDKLHLGGGRFINFRENSFEEIKKQQEKENTEIANIEALKCFYEITLRRFKDGISIKKLHPDYKLITSDNPSYCEESIYNPTSIIKMPLDEQHLLMLMPYNEKEPYFDPKHIIRSNLNEEWSYMDGHYNNIFQIENSERYLIGKRKNIENALQFFENFDSNSFADKCKAIAIKTQELLSIYQEVIIKNNNQ